MQMVGGEEDLVMCVADQECLQHVLLVPEVVMVHHDRSWIRGRQVDVVDVDEDSWLKPGQDFQVLVLHVAPHLQDVAGIDEQNVVGFKLAEFVQRNVLNLLFHEPIEARNAGADGWIWIRLNRSELRDLPGFGFVLLQRRSSDVR